MSQFGRRSMTWQQTVGVLLVIAAFIFAIMAFGEGSDLDGVRDIGRYGLAITIPLAIFLFAWNYRATHRPDEHPDILSQLVAPEQILQAGASHFAVLPRQEGACLRVSVMIQNTRAGAGRFHLTLKRKGSVFTSATPPLPGALWVDVGGASVVFADALVRLPPMHAASNLAFFLEPSFRAKGRQIRFARRAGVERRVHPVMTASLLFTGTLLTGGGITCTVPLTAVSDADAADSTDWYNWRAAEVWSPDDPVDVDIVAARLADRPTEEAV